MGATDDFDFDLDLDAGLGPRRPAHPLGLGSRVEMVRSRPIAPGSLVRVQPGDTGEVVGVTETVYAIDFGGVVARVLHADVRPLI